MPNLVTQLNEKANHTQIFLAFSMVLPESTILDISACIRMLHNLCFQEKFGNCVSSTFQEESQCPKKL